MKDLWNCVIRIKTNEGFRSHLIEKPSFTIGRTQDADLPILAPSVSRLHLRIEIKKETIWITDQQSANGTFVNGNIIESGQPLELHPGDTVRLGTAEGDFQFFAIPKPFELQDEEGQRANIGLSMEQIAREIEQKSRDQAEKEVREAKLAAEQLLSQAKRELEILRTQEAVELQERKQVVESELAGMKQTLQSEITHERLRANREADLLVADAQKTIQKDYEAASRRMETQLKDAQDKAIAHMHDAERKARAILSDAQEEAIRVRQTAGEEARKIQQEALRNTADSLKERQEKAQKEIAEAKEEVLAAARVAIERDRERFSQEMDERRQKLERELSVLVERLAVDKEAYDKLLFEKRELESSFSKIKTEYEEAVRLTAELTSLQARRLEAESALKSFKSERENGLLEMEAEFKSLREKSTVEYEKRKEEMDNELAKSRLRAMEDIQKKMASEEERYNQTMRLRALEISQKLTEVIIPEIGQLPADPDEARSRAKSLIDSSVMQVLLEGSTSIQIVAGEAEKVDPEVALKKKSRQRKLAVVAVIALIVVLSIYGKDLYALAFEMQKDNYATEMMEKRRQEAMFTPDQTPEYRDTYTDNVLYKTKYLETKSDPKYIEKWTLRLNDLETLKGMGLSEEDAVKFVAKETNLVQRLAVLRQSIDAVYLTEGLARMREAEDEAVKEFMEILKTDANYQKFREIESGFLESYVP